jgi:hypothetical protein
MLRTRERNRRRRIGRRIRHLVRTGILPPEPTKEDIQKFSEENGPSFQPGLEHIEPVKATKPTKQVSVSSDSSSSSDSDSSSDSSSDSDEDRSSADARPSMSGTGAKVAATENGDFGQHMDWNRAEALRHEAVDAQPSPEDEPALNFGRAPKDKHMASYIISSKSGPSGTSSPILTNSEHTEATVGDIPVTDASSSILEAIARRQLAAQAIPKKRARLNVDGAKRVIFGNLGQRTPKTKADEEQVRAKLMDFGKSNKAAQQPETDTSAEEVPPESEAWRSKIRVMACECVDEGIVLSEPPYPFQQRWDPQQQYWQKKKRNKKKRKSYNSEAFDYEAEYEGDGYAEEGYDDSILLNYGEEDSSAVQLYDQNAEHVEDLPLLPDDITTLPTADSDDAKEGTILAFKQLEMSANFIPEMTGYRTAKIIKHITNAPGGQMLIRLALRDRTTREPKKYDENGNRIYKGLEMPLSDDESDEESEDSGDRMLYFADLVDPRIVRMASKTDISEEAVSEAAAAQLLVEAQTGI